MEMAIAAILVVSSLGRAASPATPRSNSRTIRASRPGAFAAVARIPVVAGRGPLARLANRTVESWVRRSQAEFGKEAVATLKERGEKPPAPLEQQVSGHISFLVPERLVSVRLDTMEYLGGAHPVSGTATFNFGLVRGQPGRLSLGDLFAPGTKYRSHVSQTVIGRLREKEGAVWVQEGTVKALTPQQLDRFVIERDGLRFHLDPYEVGPYAAGAFEVKLTISDLGPAFRRPLLERR